MFAPAALRTRFQVKRSGKFSAARPGKPRCRCRGLPSPRRPAHLRAAVRPPARGARPDSPQSFDAACETSGVRIAAVTSSPSRNTCWVPSSARKSMRVSPASDASVFIDAVERNAAPLRLQRHRAIHRAGIDIDVAHHRGHAPRQRALPRADRPVNRDDNQRVFQKPPADATAIYMRLNARSISRIE